MSDADGYLRHLSAVSGFDRVSASTVYGEMARHYRLLQPGWFPLGPLPVAVWLADPPEKIVKLVQFLLVVLTFGTFAIMTRRLFGSSHAAILSGVIALAAWQLRMPHDPVIGTSFVTPIFSEWVLLSYASWLAYCCTGKAAWLGISCATAVCMMLTDPLGWGFAALLAALAMRVGSGRLRFAWLAVALAVATTTLVLDAPRLPWQRDGSYVADVVAQIIAPLPASYRGFGSLHIGGTPGLAHGSSYVDDRFINVPPVNAWSWLQIFACTIAAFIVLGNMPAKAEGRRLRTALSLGFGFWMIPALLLGPRELWHGGMPLGQSFDGVYLQYFGIAIVATAGLLRLREGAGPVTLLAPSLSALAVFFFCYGNARTNAASILKTQRSAYSTASIERAGAAGFFDVLPPGRTLAVAASEPFADGIHFSVSDAKYAIYHYSKRRYNVVDAGRLRRTPKVDAWVLQTSRTSGIFVTLAHDAGYDGRTLKTDRAYGFSAISDVRDALALPARGVVVKTWQLRDGFAIRARRTCGPVASDVVYAGEHPTFSWGSGFYHRGPLGYSNGVGVATEMFMGSKATLVLRPTTCSPRPLIFQATLETAGPATLVTKVHFRVQRLFITSFAPLAIRAPESKFPVQVRFLTDAPAADWDPIYFRYERDRPRDLRLRFFAASISEGPAVTRHRRRARKQS